MGPEVYVKESLTKIVFSSGNIRGANGQRNLTWDTQYGGVHPCSIGVSVSDGYFTAGHCGYEGHEISNPSGTKMGDVEGSKWFEGKDVGHVDTLSAWTPQPYINGYNDGLISVPAKFSGTISAATNTTVCRYGQTSQFADCGTIAQKSITSGDFSNLTKVSGMCSSDGDSGGPYLSTSNHIQGTNMGYDENTGTVCPGSGDTYFQPISDHIANFADAQTQVLTSHGSNAPMMGTVTCFNRGYASYFCSVNTYDSQGETSLSWSSSTSHSGSGLSMSGSCSTTQVVNVTVTGTNTYGSGNSGTSFTCSTGPLQ